MKNIKDYDLKELKEELNKILEYLHKSGKLNRIKDKWIPNLHKAG